MESESRDLVDEVLKKIGRNILLFQQIEKGLKLLLPFIVHPNSIAKNIVDFRKQRESVKSQTLGSLINTFVKSVDYDIDYFAENLKKIVDERNKLVHHFGDLSDILSTKEGCKTCIARLEAQYQEAIYFYKYIELCVFTLLMLLREHYGESNPEFELLYKRLRPSVVCGVEYVNLSNPFDTEWENTKIVKLLRLAELNTEKIGVMTSLTRAGKFIKKQDPDCIPKRYGIKTLKGVLKASGLFEVIESQNGEPSDVLYKSAD